MAVVTAMMPTVVTAMMPAMMPAVVTTVVPTVETAVMPAVETAMMATMMMPVAETPVDGRIAIAIAIAIAVRVIVWVSRSEADDHSAPNDVRRLAAFQISLDRQVLNFHA
jgi:mucin-5B